MLHFASVIDTPVPTGKCSSTWFQSLILIFFHFREVPGTDVSSSVETDKENEELDDTDQLLDSTYDVNKIPKLDGKFSSDDTNFYMIFNLVFF